MFVVHRRSRSRSRGHRDRDHERSRKHRDYDDHYRRERNHDRSDREKYKRDKDRDGEHRHRHDKRPRSKSHSNSPVPTAEENPGKILHYNKFKDNDNEITEEEAEMQRIFGFSNFSSTKGKHVIGNSVYVAKILKQRKYRQYMNRRGGFNHPLDFVA